MPLPAQRLLPGFFEFLNARAQADFIGLEPKTLNSFPAVTQRLTQRNAFENMLKLFLVSLAYFNNKTGI